MMLYNVEFSYDIEVEADTMKQAADIACNEWNEIKPAAGEMNVEVNSYID